jgi:hypothetical protein
MQKLLGLLVVLMVFAVGSVAAYSESSSYKHEVSSETHMQRHYESSTAWTYERMGHHGSSSSYASSVESDYSYSSAYHALTEWTHSFSWPCW